MTPTDFGRLFLLAALWGGSFLFMRIAVPALGAVPTAFSRVLLGAMGLVCLARLLRVTIRFNGKLAATMALGAINSGAPFLLFAIAASTLPAGYSAILNATAPLMGALIGFLAFGERLTIAKVAGVSVGLVGVAVLTGAGPVSLSPAVWWSIAACLLAAAFYGLAGFLTRRWIAQKGGLDSRIVALGSQLGAVLMLLPFAVWKGVSQPIEWTQVSAAVWGSILTLGLLCTSLAYVLYFRLIADVGPLKALSVTFLIPLFGILWGALVLGESVTIAHGGGAGLIGIAVWLVLRTPVAAITPSSGASAIKRST